MKVIRKKFEPYSKLKGLLKERGILQREMAEYLEMDRITFNKKINGHGTDFTGTEIRKICLKLKISADDFFINNKVS